MIKPIRAAIIALFAGGSVFASNTKVPMGNFNGDQESVLVTVRVSKVRVEMGCSHGEFPRPSMDDKGHFHADGWLQSDMYPPHPKKKTVFEGSIANGRYLSLRMLDEKGRETETVTLVKSDTPKNIIKCK